MTDEKLQKAIGINCMINFFTRLIEKIDKGGEVEIRFANGGYCCGNEQSELLSEAEVEEIVNNISSTLRSRAEARLKELQDEYNQL